MHSGLSQPPCSSSSNLEIHKGFLRFSSSIRTTDPASALRDLFFHSSSCLCHASYGGNFRYTLPCVSLQSHEENRQGKPVSALLPRRYTPCSRVPSRPIHGHTPRKLPPFRSNLPHHRRLRSFHALNYDTTGPGESQSFFGKRGRRISDKKPGETGPSLGIIAQIPPLPPLRKGVLHGTIRKNGGSDTHADHGH